MFDSNRKGTFSLKYDGFRQDVKGYEKCDQPLIFWLADLDLPTPRWLSATLAKAVEKDGLSYSHGLEDRLKQTLLNHYKKQGLSFPAQNIVIKGGLNTHLMLFLYGNGFLPEDGVLLMTPVYHGFNRVLSVQNRFRTHQYQLQADSTRFEIEFGRLEQTVRSASCKVMLICNPHNPTGRIWTQAELIAIVDLCKRYSITLICDQVMSELAFKPFISLVSLFGRYENLVVLNSPTKAYNLQGLQAGFGIYNNKRQAQRTQQFIRKFNMQYNNRLQLVASIAAYQQGGQLIKQLKEAIIQNYALLKQELKLHLPKAVLFELEGSYLVTIDFSAYFKDYESLLEHLRRNCVVVNDMRPFEIAPRGRRWVRLSIGCQPKLIKMMVGRLALQEATL